MNEATGSATRTMHPESALQAMRGPVRLRTLTTLRWLAVGGQSAAIFLVHFGLGFTLPLGLCLAAIAASAWLNLFTILRFSPQRMLSDGEATIYMIFDIGQLLLLLFLTGGLQNPFSALILAPVTIAASVLALRYTIMVGAFAVAGISILAGWHLPLPWRVGETLALPQIYAIGVWTALTFSVAFFAIYAHRIAKESAQMKNALAASQMVLAREERLAAIGGLAAAAAHELGTPLATIQVTAKEMAGELAGKGGHLEEDALLLVSQAERCRDILGRLSNRGEEGDAMLERIGVDLLLREAAEPFLDQPDGATVIFEMYGAETSPETPVLRRRTEIIYGLRNLIENAVSYARSKVLVTAEWDENTLTVIIHDDGPGFAAEMLARLGEPYVSARSRARAPATRKGGLGLGFFIAKTLLERSGGRVDFDNLPWSADPAASGAWVRIVWPLSEVRPPLPPRATSRRS